MTPYACITGTARYLKWLRSLGGKWYELKNFDVKAYSGLLVGYTQQNPCCDCHNWQQFGKPAITTILGKSGTQPRLIIVKSSRVYNINNQSALQMAVHHHRFKYIIVQIDITFHWSRGSVRYYCGKFYERQIQSLMLLSKYHFQEISKFIDQLLLLSSINTYSNHKICHVMIHSQPCQSINRQ